MGSHPFGWLFFSRIDDEGLYGAENPGYCRPRVLILAYLLLNFFTGIQSIGTLQLIERSLSSIGLHRAGMESFTPERVLLTILHRIV